MTREEWINIKQRGSNIPLSVWFEYYREQGGHVQDIAEFRNLFDQLVDGVFPKYIGSRKVSKDIALLRLYQYYDEKFDTFG